MYDELPQYWSIFSVHIFQNHYQQPTSLLTLMCMGFLSHNTHIHNTSGNHFYIETKMRWKIGWIYSHDFSFWKTVYWWKRYFMVAVRNGGKFHSERVGDRMAGLRCTVVIRCYKRMWLLAFIVTLFIDFELFSLKIVR